jgi:transcriptional regulator with XRE-family HTH domain
MITISQIRAARALLNWTQGELAKKSGLSLRALNSIERGLAVPRLDNLRLIQETLEKADIEFSENDGVRRRTERLEIIKFEGKEFLTQHLLDIMQEVRAPGSEILFNVLSEKDSAGMSADILDAYFAHLQRYRIGERLLMATGETYVIAPPSIHRWLKSENFNHVYYIVYGDNVAFQIFGEPHRTIIIRNPGMADMFRRQFEFNWAMAEIPWFAKRYKAANPQEPWTAAKGAAAREWIANTKL